METQVIRGDGQPVVLAPPGQPALAGRQDVVDLLGRCFEAESRGLLLHAFQWHI